MDLPWTPSVLSIEWPLYDEREMGGKRVTICIVANSIGPNHGVERQTLKTLLLSLVKVSFTDSLAESLVVAVCCSRVCVLGWPLVVPLNYSFSTTTRELTKDLSSLHLWSWWANRRTGGGASACIPACNISRPVGIGRSRNCLHNVERIGFSDVLHKVENMWKCLMPQANDVCPLKTH